MESIIMKIALNKDFGGFSLSKDSYERLIKLGMTVTTQTEHDNSKDIIKFDDHYMFINDDDHKYRTDERLIQMIEEHKSKISIKIIDVPKLDEYFIDNKNGIESVRDINGIIYG